MRRVRSNQGQASIEWVAVVGVVIVALVVAGAASGAPQIGAVVTRQLRRALCIVARGDCDEDRAPCVVRSDTNTEASSATFVVIRVSDTTTVLVEGLSDGTWRITRTHDLGAGGELGIGANVSFSGLGLKLALGGEARAWVLAHSGKGEIWPAHSEAEAKAVVQLLAIGRHPPGRPAQRFSQHGTLANLQGSVNVPGGTFGGQIADDDVSGTRTDTATGRTTTYLRERLDLDASFQFGKGAAGVAAHDTTSTNYALTTDRTGRPVDFQIVSVGQLTGAAGLPGFAKGARGLPNARAADGDAWEREQHLDLTDPENLAAATAFMKSYADPGADLGALVVNARALDARLAVDGIELLRTYDLHQSSFGAAASAALGIKVAGSYRKSSASMKLLSAEVRGPDGIWTARDDCVEQA